MITAEQNLLLAIAADTARVAALPRLDHERRSLRVFGVRRRQWFGGDASGRNACRRGLASLQTKGLVELHSEFQRVSHAKLTPAGRRAAVAIVEAADAVH